MVKHKYCFVPNCYNSSRDCSQKIFIRVPYNSKVRTKWYAAVNSNQTLNSSKHVFCCEDHFDLENDAENWMYFKMMGSKIILKKDVLPNKKIKGKYCGSQLSDSDKKRKRKNLKAYSYHKRSSVQLPSTLPLNFEILECSWDSAHFIQSSFIMCTPPDTVIISSPSECGASMTTYLESSSKKIQNKDNIMIQNSDGEKILKEPEFDIEDRVVTTDELETVKNVLLGNMNFDDKNEMLGLLDFKNVPIPTEEVFIITKAESASALPTLSVKSDQQKQQREACTCLNCSRGIKVKKGKKQHICHIPRCNKAFRRTDNLQAHLRWHSGEKPFICDSCGKRFRRLDKLRRHLRTHTRKRTYKCIECDKTFMRSDHLTNHMKLHQKLTILDVNGINMQMKVESESSEDEEILGDEYLYVSNTNINEDELRKGNLNNKEDDWKATSLTVSAVYGNECNYDEEMMITIKEEDEFITADPLDMNYLD